MSIMLLCCLLVACIAYYAAGYPAEDKISALPGWSPLPLPSAQYSGFLDGNANGSLKLHYWLVEAEVENPLEAPLLLWFNGGPGASSLYGLLVELGPFLLSDLSLQGAEYAATGIPQLLYNPYGWQKTANILAISMPPPIGYSYCTPPGPSATGDDCGPWSDASTAQVTYNAILSFMRKFPEYSYSSSSSSSMPVYLSGESYAGVYVPEIVKLILAGNKASPSSSNSEYVNIKGFAVGDACTPPAVCGSDPIGPLFNLQFLFGKSAFSNKLWLEIQATCTQDELAYGGLSPACQSSVDKVAGEVGGYWAYAYYDDCWYENDIRRRRSLRDLLSNSNSFSNKQQSYWGPPIAHHNHRAHSSSSSSSKVVDIPNGYACGGPSAQVEWLSLPVVKEALHIPQDAVFFQSDNGVGFTYTFGETDLVSWYKQVIAANELRVLVYNGDTDPCINAFQAQNWTASLGFAETQSWRPWTTDACQAMGGTVTRYENNFDFLTIRGSGHMVPQFKSKASLEFITQWLKNEDYKPFVASCTAPPAASASASSSSAFSSSSSSSHSSSNKEEEALIVKEIERGAHCEFDEEGAMNCLY